MRLAASTVVSAYAAALCAAVALTVSPVGAENQAASILLAFAACTATLFGVFAPMPPPRRNIFRGSPGFYLLILFNIVLLTGIVLEVLALLVLLGSVPPVREDFSKYVWSIAILLTVLQITVVLSRRAGSARPALGSNLAILLGLVTAIDLGLWTNAAFVGHANIFFITTNPLYPFQVVYLVLLGLLLQSLGLMVVLRIPTLLELLFEGREERERTLSLTSASPLSFTLVFSAIVFIFLTIVGLSAGRVGGGGVLVPNVGVTILLAFFGTVVLSIAVVAWLMLRRNRRRYRHKLERTTKVFALLVVLAALATGFFAFLAWRLSTGPPMRLGPLLFGRAFATEALVLCLLSATGPVGFYLHRQKRRIEQIEERLSDFLQDLAETAKSGLPLHASLHVASSKDYGPLNSEITRMAHQVSWGMAFDEAFERFGARTKSTLVRRTTALVVESARNGGNANEVLSAAAQDIYEIKSVEADRRVSMTTYLIVIYLVYFVFLSILATLAAVFLPQLLAGSKASGASPSAAGVYGGVRVNIEAVKTAYFYALLVQGAGNGLVCGAIRDGSLAGGLRHVFIMIIIAYGAFRILM